jgi:hypothetical protein
MDEGSVSATLAPVVGARPWSGTVAALRAPAGVRNPSAHTQLSDQPAALGAALRIQHSADARVDFDRSRGMALYSNTVGLPGQDPRRNGLRTVASANGLLYAVTA